MTTNREIGSFYIIDFSSSAERLAHVWENSDRGRVVCRDPETNTLYYVVKSGAGVDTMSTLSPESSGLLRTSGDYDAFAAKAVPAASDTVLIESQADGKAKRRVAVSTLTSVSVKSYGAVGDGSTDDATAVGLAIASGAKIVTFPQSGTYRVNSDVTFAAGQRVVMEEGAKIKPASGKTVKIGRLTALDTQCVFDLSLGGLISFAASGFVPIVYADWWGAVADGGPGTGTNNGPFINQAIKAVAVGVAFTSCLGGTVRLGSGGTYSTSTPIDIKYSDGVSGIVFEGHAGGANGYGGTTRLMWIGTEPSATGTTGVSGGHLTVSGLSGISPAPFVGGWMIISGAAHAANNGAWLVTDFTAGVATLKLIDQQLITVAVPGAFAGDSCTATSVTKPVIRLWSADNIIRNLTINNNGKPLYCGIDETQDPGGGLCTHNTYERVRVEGSGPLVHCWVHGDDANHANPPVYPYNCENSIWDHCMATKAIGAQVYCPNTTGQSKKCEFRSTPMLGNGATKLGFGVFWKSGGLLLHECDLGANGCDVSCGTMEQLLLKECGTEGSGKLVIASSLCNMEGGRYSLLSLTDNNPIQFYGGGCLNLRGVQFDQSIGLSAVKIFAKGADTTHPAHVTADGCRFWNLDPFDSSAAVGVSSLDMNNCVGIDPTSGAEAPLPNRRQIIGSPVDVGSAFYADEPAVGWSETGLRLRGTMHRLINTGASIGEAAWSDEITAHISTADAADHTLVSAPVFPGNNNQFGTSGVCFVEVCVTANLPGTAGNSAAWKLIRGFTLGSTHLATAMGATVTLHSCGTNAGAVPAGWTALLDTDGAGNVTVVVKNTGGQATNWALTKSSIMVAN